jgi:hypothetical protein
MKPTTRTFLIFLLLSLSAGSCKKDDDDNPSNNSDNFSEYFYCKINGEEFQPRGTPSCNNRSFYYYPAGTGGLSEDYILISGRDCPSNLGVAIRIFNPTPAEGNFDMLSPEFADSISPSLLHIDSEEGVLTFQELIGGYLHIVTFTPRDSVTLEYGRIEGTFEFSVTNENQDSIIHITEGAFRFKVPNMW